MTSPYALMDAYMEGLLNDDQFEALKDWLHEDPAHAHMFAVWVQAHCQIHEHLLGEDIKRDLAGCVNAPGHTDGEHDNHVSSVVSLDADAEWEHWLSDCESSIKAEAAVRASAEAMSSRELLALAGYLVGRVLTSRPAYKAYAIAAVLLLAVTLFLVFGGEQAPGPHPHADQAVGTDIETDPPVVSPSPVVAKITATHNARWAERDLAPGSQLRVGTRLTLTAGFAEITTARGAVAILEAPATFELLDNDNALQLHAGKLVGLCHTVASKGFVVRTDHSDITDLGTEFGVTATSDGVEASVFVGEVAVKLTHAPPQVIHHSQTARVSVEQGRPTLAVEDKPATGYAQRLPRAALITDASISLPRFKVEVVPKGFYEDTRLYTDRDHEINGVDAAGLPSQLLGGDLVRMPADARPDRLAPKDGHTLRLDIHLSAPADLYLLIEPQFADGDWLRRDYERTGMTIGKDSVGGSEARGTGEQQEGGVGPGVSVDQAFEVWKRKQPASGRTTVAGAMTRGMYALIAVPAQQAGPHE